MAAPHDSGRSVFLNIPYDAAYTKLYVALIAGLYALGLEPRAALEVPSGDRRLDRIFELIIGSRYSIHDLSRVQLSAKPPRTPRFNMPFELGLLIGWRKAIGAGDDRHRWIVMESQERRLQKSLSDLNGTDPLIHDGNVKGVLRELGNAFAPRTGGPRSMIMEATFEHASGALPAIIRESRAKSAFEPVVFHHLKVVAASYARMAK